MIAPHKVRFERRVPAAPRTMTRRVEGVLIAALVIASSVVGFLPIALAEYRRALDCPRYSGEGDPSFAGLSATRGMDNWTVTLVAGLRRMYPDTTSIELLDAQHRVLLEPRPWSSLTLDRWSENLVVSVDNHPGLPPVCEGDQLLVDIQAYPRGSILEILSGGVPLGWTTFF